MAPPAATVLVGWTAFLAGIALLTLVHPTAIVALIVVSTGFAAGLQLIPAPREPLAAGLTPPWWDLPARALSALTLVVALTAVSGALGAHLSGLLAPFPIITSVLAVFTHVHGGADQVRVLARNFLLGFYGFATFCFTLAVTLDSMGTAAAFALALLAAVVVQATAFAFRSRLEASRSSAAAMLRA